MYEGICVSPKFFQAAERRAQSETTPCTVRRHCIFRSYASARSAGRLDAPSAYRPSLSKESREAAPRCAGSQPDPKMTEIVSGRDQIALSGTDIRANRLERDQVWTRRHGRLARHERWL